MSKQKYTRRAFKAREGIGVTVRLPKEVIERLEQLTGQRASEWFTNAALEKTGMIYVFCRRCGKPFVGNTRSIYCSEACKQSMKRVLHQAVPIESSDESDESSRESGP